ncbi:MAG: cyclic nucleotide-binding domain-containing protein [Myxococcales bacterium]|nr:cyclic nucleotide-binding domain-containing protein [Myxococcales bacterium]
MSTDMPPSGDDAERQLRLCLARMRIAPLDFRLRVNAGELLVALGDKQRGIRVLRSCADYFTLAGFPLRALWALKLLERYDAGQAVVDRGLNLLAKHYAATPDAEWGDAIFEMPLPKTDALNLDLLPPTLEGVMAEVDRRATDIIRGATFPDRLPRFPLLSELAAEPFLTVARAVQLRRVADGTPLVEEGEPGQAVHVVVTGTMRVIKRGAEGLDTELARLGEGEVFGEMSLVTESPRVATVMAEGSADVFELPRTVLDELGTQATDLQAALSKQVCDRMIGNLMNLSPVFRVLPPDRRSDLMARFQSRLVEADDDIIVEGQVGKGLFVILDGLVQVTRRKSGHKHILNWLREGEIFGEISLLRNTPATATCTAARRTMLMFLAREEFEDITRQYPEVVEKMNELGEFRLLDNIYTLA